MSVRYIGTRLFKHGTAIIRHIAKRDLHSANIAEKINAVPAPTQPSRTFNNQVISRSFGLRNVGVQIGLQARRILIDNVLNRVTNSLAAELRKRAARRILYGDSGPFLAFVGVSLASGTGILTKEEELEGVCWEIREAISKIKWSNNDTDIDETRFEDSPITLNDISFEKPIAKGANAVVYAANIKPNGTTENESNEPMINAIQAQTETDNMSKFPLAIKMMFNYDIQSNAMAILNAMYRETVPARLYYSNIGISEWEIDLSERNRYLPQHPNIVTMYSVFTDYVPELENARALYPQALPERIYSEGVGRNMSLFLIMKRYNLSLQNYLSSITPSTRTSILLFAQLLEGVAHLTAHGIAHRDLKSDNLLLDTTDSEAPILVISDFGCCLADKNNGLMLPYTSFEIDKGGNAALMAPEIVNQKPGKFSELNYTKSDLWAAGTIGYEMFRCVNPFYGNSEQQKLMNSNYKEEDLPVLPEEIPAVIRMLLLNCLKRNPNKRLNPEVAANVCNLYLWAPSSWLKPSIKLPSSYEILQWLLSLTTKVLCEGKSKFGQPTTQVDGNIQYSTGRRTYPEYLLISSFLCRAKLSNIKAALSWMRNVTYEIDY